MVCKAHIKKVKKIVKSCEEMAKKFVLYIGGIIFIGEESRFGKQRTAV